VGALRPRSARPANNSFTEFNFSGVARGELSTASSKLVAILQNHSHLQNAIQVGRDLSPTENGYVA
jgi:hypothetical protein